MYNIDINKMATDEELLERKMIFLIRKLNELYNIKLNGNFKVKLNIIRFYGLVIEIEKINEPYSLFERFLEIQITFNFFPEIILEAEDIIEIIPKELITDIYFYKDKYYYFIDLKDNDSFLLNRFLEYGNIVTEDVLKVKRYGKNIKCMI